MVQFVSVPALVEAWRVPDWGCPADEPAPTWLVRALQDEALFVNHLGGLSRRTLFGDEDCYCGDYVVMLSDETIGFRPGPAFSAAHERISRRIQD